MITEKFKINK